MKTAVKVCYKMFYLRSKETSIKGYKSSYIYQRTRIIMIHTRQEVSGNSWSESNPYLFTFHFV